MIIALETWCFLNSFFISFNFENDKNDLFLEATETGIGKNIYQVVIFSLKLQEEELYLTRMKYIYSCIELISLNFVLKSLSKRN